MKTVLKFISFAALLLMFSSAILVFNDQLSRERYYVLSLLGTVAWFATIPFWMKRRLHESS